MLRSVGGSEVKMNGRFYMPGAPEIISPSSDLVESVLVALGKILNFMGFGK